MTKKITPIGSKDVHKITSGQIIIDLVTAVKELVDNSIDAHATQIDIIFKNYGIESIECSDNGDGITPENYEFLALKHYTSKISTFDDVLHIQSLGFRGEALSSLCGIAKLIVTTTSDPPKADRLEYDRSGKLNSRTITSRNAGTTIQISKLFENLPVRRKEFIRTCRRQFTKCISLLQGYAIIQENIKFSVWNVSAKGRKTSVLSTPLAPSIPKKVLSIFGPSSTYGLDVLDLALDLNPLKKDMMKKYVNDTTFLNLDYTIQVKGYISKHSLGCGRNSKDRQFFYINKRPIEYPQLSKCCNDIYRQFNNAQFPSIFLNLVIPPQVIDVNVTPDKRIVFLQNEKYVLEELKIRLYEYFDNQDLVLPKQQSILKNHQSRIAKKRRLESTKENEKYATADSITKFLKEKGKENVKSCVISKPSTDISYRNLNDEEELVVVKIEDDTFKSNAKLANKDLVFSGKDDDLSSCEINTDNKFSNNDLSDEIDVNLEKIEKRVRFQLPPPLKEHIRHRSFTDNKYTKPSKASSRIVCLRVRNLMERIRKELKVVSVFSQKKRDNLVSAEPATGMKNIGEGDQYLTLMVKKEDFKKMKIVGQFNLGFIIVTRKIGNDYDLFVIDQHAADEKYNFERLQKITTFKSQRLIVPQPVELSIIDELIVIDNHSTFEKNGFKLIIDKNASQGQKIKIVALPVSKQTMINIDDFNELIHAIRENAGLNTEDLRCSKYRKLFAMRACRSSVMVGKPLTKKAMTTIVHNLSDLKKPWNCPHGRPTMRHLTELHGLNSFTKDYEI
ncbi:ATP-binding mismatch repair protein NDAI_0F02510 [Naumovozyma dairenensis CBS 421]|uniref:DNA mismatch repair protein PMS1 n=1 Tax=Naumovozyma dairenensis (strain ATCC 10597 / BCRC 20456 / CBS 421 / NBRC 0211 / NRRL Y-12639) TaxID=1071378 RepID=G0WCQ8_NAUDC|nr:hypothetical protein NDAI_0F02510 [Naumovozyma dairenensis CBS 421]CCD25569.1 hypothetical protein NDAI_0F02510 [Naumovozyma dairenensis CBS 421]